MDYPSPIDETDVRGVGVIHKVPVSEQKGGRVQRTLKERMGKVPQRRWGCGSAWEKGIFLERVLTVGGGPLPGHKSYMGKARLCVSVLTRHSPILAKASWRDGKLSQDTRWMT